MNYITVIDDSPTIRTSVEYAVKKLGYPIMQAENGADALEKINTAVSKGDEIALCVVDVNMPVMDGITFVKEFRKIDRFTPLIILTTESEEGKIREGKEAGASGWIVKPFQPEGLIEVVNKLIR
jgi:two-component system chemotaxis response regulator CheY